ncbi:ABC transporter ATP-binding protein [Jiella sp. MQZ9-1]|uniref:ABC transporter ATP-binding protein n=1 Tax=Jiella flava TaxID=2816857 RepID=A0A939FUZ4_9HYPH|nr:ABC transporter ATP-binding protein [Jiella flava]MBO0662438.1 ABC transporter ATP-binding protein [Jiella flava]MCD2471662.1 ABC transporter ATP-binding protein [Jiella flava]
MTTLPVPLRGEVALRGLHKSFALEGRSIPILTNFDLTIRGGESLAIVGASGAGKTTLLRILAGLETADTGDILIDGEPAGGLGSACAVIFQEPRLLPWLTVLRNVAFGLEARGTAPATARERAGRYLRLVGLAGFEEAYPRQLSGGMAQRVGIARALTTQPEILLLDEPFGALDAMTKLAMQEELVRIWREENVTMVTVTHDLEEAVFLADRVLVLSRNRTQAPRLIDVSLPRPRERTSSAFVALRQELMAEFGLH